MADYSGEGVQAFVCALEDLHSSNILYSDRKLTRVLKCLAYYEELSSVISYCNRGFNYKAEKAHAISTVSDRPVFRLPKNPKNVVGLISGLLFEFDQNMEDLVTFATTYFPSVSKNESFEIFYEKVLVPFKLAVVDFVINGTGEPKKIVDRVVDFAPDGLHQQVESLLLGIYNDVQDLAVEEDVRSRLLVQIEGFAAALDARDTLLIKAVWYGLKSALDAVSVSAKECEQIEEVMKMYLVS